MRKKKIKVLAVVGKSGSGKSTIINNIANRNFHSNNYELEKFIIGADTHIVKSYTTRNIWLEDPNDINTHEFVCQSFYDNNVNEVIAVYHSSKGYTSWTDITSFDPNKINLYAIDAIAVRDIYNDPRFDVTIVYVDIDEDVRAERYFKRERTYEGFYDEPELDKSKLNGLRYITINNS